MEGVMPSTEQIRRTVDGYVRSFRTEDKDLFLDLLAADVEQEDPVGDPPNRGKEALGNFFDTVFGVCESIDFDARELYISGDQCALVFSIAQHRKDGSVVTLDGVDTFRIDDQGKVALLRGYAAERS
jgi:steroid Delta-isomerase